MSQKYLLLCIVALVCLSYDGRAQQQEHPPSASSRPVETPAPVGPDFMPEVSSHVPSLELASVTRHDDDVSIVLKNVSDKKIYLMRMAYYRDGTALLFDRIISEGETSLINPGETYEYKHTIIANSILARQPLTFQAVVFEDGTGDGEIDKVESLQNMLRKSRGQLRSVLKFIKGALRAEGEEPAVVLRRLEGQLSALPNSLEGVDLRGLAGIVLPEWKMTADDHVKDLMQRLQEGKEINLGEELSKVKDDLEKSLSRFPAISDQ
ncbi:MAG: hypothetical protein M3268_03700 [Acidobacteriota bacterium]|nr:hypothetical protein [Acidobacteriota bacterium]